MFKNLLPMPRKIVLSIILALGCTAGIAEAQEQRERVQMAQISVTVVEGLQIGPCSFDPNQLCADAEAQERFDSGNFGLRIVRPKGIPLLKSALASIASNSRYDEADNLNPRTMTAQIWDRRI